MHIQNGGWWNLFELFKLTSIQIINAFPTWRFHKVSVLVDTDSVRFVQHVTQVSVAL